MQPIAAQILFEGLTQPEQLQGKTITAVVTDSRAICEGCVFVCFVGQRVDGHDFALQALEQGAAFVVANHPLEGADPSRVIVCPDSKQAMIQMGENYRRQFHPKVVGITGSVGKTTTKEFCSAVLSRGGKIIKTQGNQNNEIGVPNTLFQLEQDTQFAVVEMGMSALGEISQLSRAAKPDVGIITCIGVSHMESLGSKENIRKAKLEICEGLPSGAPLILNGDDPMLRQAQYEGLLPTHVRPIWYSTEDDGADVWASEIVFTQKGQRFWLNDRKHGRFWVEIPALGVHTIRDALAAYTAGVALGLSPEECAKALEDYQPAPLRQSLRTVADVLFVEDCYNASPDSMKASLVMFCQIPCEGVRIAFLGDMLELGELSQQAHYEVGELVMQTGMKFLVAVGEQSKVMVERARELGVKSVWCETLEEAVGALYLMCEPGGAVLVKASRGMQLEKALHQLYPRLEQDTKLKERK